MPPTSGDDIWGSLGSLFTSGDSSGLINATIKAISSEQPPDLRATIFVTIYSNFEGVVLAFAILSGLLTFLRYLSKYGSESESPLTGVRNAFIAAGAAYLLPGIATSLIWVDQSISNGLSAWFGDPAQWASSYQSAPSLSGSGIGATILIVVWAVVSFFLWILVQLMNFALYFTIFGLLVSLIAFLLGKVGDWTRRLLSLTIITIFLKIILILPMAVGGQTVNASNGNADSKAVGAILMLIIVCFLPFWLMKKTSGRVRAFIENKSLNARLKSGRFLPVGTSANPKPTSSAPSSSTSSQPSQPMTARKILRSGTAGAKEDLRSRYQSTRQQLANHGKSKARTMATRLLPPQIQGGIKAIQVGRRIISRTREDPANRPTNRPKGRGDRP